MRKGHTTLIWTMVALLVPALAVAGCGKSKKKSTAASTLDVTVSESGKSAKYSVPSSVKGGLVRVTVANHGKAPHAAQLVRLEGNHTVQDALKIINSQSNNTKVPNWIHGEGGVGAAPPGAPVSATVVLPAGKYFVADLGGPGSSGPPGYAEFTVTSGPSGSLPSTPTTITAANPSKDKYKWEVSGSLKSGASDLTFVSKGKNTIHFIGAFRLNGNASKEQVIKALKSNGKPPSFVDTSSFANTAVLDSGKSDVTPFRFSKPGKYVLFCPLSDRDGRKPHFEEGLLTTVDVK
ncbi:MAG: hypothetical protein E6G00_04555 [Actinobacteria bacterium]|nr:MAG: hypothetical protein E6G00_04555 [Actinomycetota bacterium]